MQSTLSRRLVFVLQCLPFVLVAQPIGANPVPDDVVMEFRALIRQTVDAGACPDPANLADLFGRYGLDLLESEERAAIEEDFALFAPILAESQSPRHALQPDIQDLFRGQADAEQRELLLRSLRGWLDAEISEAPPQGSIQIVGPGEGVAEAILRSRIHAAELLASWGDRSSCSGMKALSTFLADFEAAYPVRPGTDELRWHLDRALRVLDDPSTMTMFAIAEHGRLVFCGQRDDLRRITLRRGDWRSIEIVRECTSTEVDRIWSLLGSTEPSKTRVRRTGGTTIVLEFKSGLRACLEPAGRDRLVYSDNASLGYRPRIVVRNLELAGALDRLIKPA